jgi:hypothetical protein
MEEGMADADWWACGTALGSFAVAAIALVLSRRDGKPRVHAYSHRATDHPGGILFLVAHPTAIGPNDPVIAPLLPVNLYLIVWRDRETELSKGRRDR